MPDPNESRLEHVREVLHKMADAKQPNDSQDEEAMTRVAGAAVESFLSSNLDSSAPAAQVNSTEFHELMDSLRSGSIAAVWQLIESYEPHIRRVISRRINSQLRSKYDTMDFVQMVWKSFFEDPQKIFRLTTPAQLGAYLRQMAQRKVTDEYRRTTTQKYDVSRELPLKGESVAAPNDTPSQIAMARERWDQMLDGLPSNHREIIRLRLEGLTFEQIGERLSVDEKTARRVLNRVTEKLVQTS